MLSQVGVERPNFDLLRPVLYETEEVDDPGVGIVNAKRVVVGVPEIGLCQLGDRLTTWAGFGSGDTFEYSGKRVHESYRNELTGWLSSSRLCLDGSLGGMVTIAVVFGVLSGLLHIQFWLLEAMWWRQERIWKRFGVKSQDQADGLAFNMLNQGYYNLFLGIGAVVGAILLAVEVPARTTLLGYCCLFMVGAGLVLFVSRRSMARAALIQAVPPLITLIALIWI